MVLDLRRIPWVILISTLLIGVLAQGAVAANPKWFVREGIAKHERELSGSLKLKQLNAAESVDYFVNEGTFKFVHDDCTKSRIEELVVTGGSPGTAKISKLVLTGCEEFISSDCRTASKTEEITAEKLKGELVDGLTAGTVYLHVVPPSQPFFKVKLICFGTECTIQFKGSILVEPSRGYVVNPPFSFSPNFTKFKNNSTGKEEEAVLTSEEILCGDESGLLTMTLQNTIDTKLVEPPPETKELKAE
jgi:hypothetical protein